MAAVRDADGGSHQGAVQRMQRDQCARRAQSAMTHERARRRQLLRDTRMNGWRRSEEQAGGATVQDAEAQAGAPR